MYDELQASFPGWKVAFSGSREEPRRMGLIDEHANFRASVPFPNDEKLRGENVYRALFATLLELAHERSAKTTEAITSHTRF